MEELTVHKTHKYDIFKFIQGNREIYQPHLARLIKSIGANNLLSNNPIIVNDKLEVIDGQHRLQAAQALGIDIYYMIAPAQTLSAVQLLNANNRAWTTDDYLKSYVELGKKDYVTLMEFSSEYKVSIPIAMILLTGSYTTHAKMVRDFRDGKFVVKDAKEAENVASFLVELRRFSPDNAWADRRCLEAAHEWLQDSDPKKVVKQLEDFSLRFTKRYSKKEYLLEFEDILNFK